MEEQNSSIKESKNISPKVLSEKKEASVLPIPLYKKSYCRIQYRLSTIEYNWEILHFFKIYKFMKIFASTRFPENEQYQVQIEIASFNSPSEKELLRIYMTTEEEFAGSYEIFFIDLKERELLVSTDVVYISKRMLLYEKELGLLIKNSDSDAFELNFRFDIFYSFSNTTIHVNPLPSSAAKDLKSEKSILDNDSKFDNKESLEFIIDGQHYSVSKNRLCAINSSYFKHLCNTEEDITNELIIKDRPKAFQEMLSFIIINSARPLDLCLEQWIRKSGMVKDLLIVANKYDVQNLKTICEEILLQNITFENALELIQLALLNDAKCLEKCVASFIKFYIEKFLRFETFLSLPQEQIDKILEATEKIDSKDCVHFV